MCGDAVMVEPLGCVMKLRWLNCGKVWVKLRWLKPIRHKRELLVGCVAHTSAEISMGTLQASGSHCKALYRSPSLTPKEV
jgi:hypothetical protein